MLRMLTLLTCLMTTSALAEAIPPKPETDFVEVASLIRQLGLLATSEIELGSYRARRDNAICQIIPDLTVSNWHGTIYSIRANGDGKGVVEIALADSIYLKTWNNFISDAMDKTMIEPGTPMHNALLTLKKGDGVIFSGRFIADPLGETCIHEPSFTLRGKVTEPEFIFKFTALLPAQQ